MNYGDGEAGVLLRCVDEALIPSSIGSIIDQDVRLNDSVCPRNTILMYLNIAEQ